MARILRESARLRRGALRAHASIAVRFRQMAALDAGMNLISPSSQMRTSTKALGMYVLSIGAYLP